MLPKLTMRYLFITLILSLFSCQQKPEPVKVQPNLLFRTELFFGLPKPEDSVTTSWEAFADSVITPFFPDGYTVSDAEGRWRSSDSAKTVKEQSKVVTIIHSYDDHKSAAIDSIIERYKTLFKQQSVLRADGMVTSNLGETQ